MEARGCKKMCREKAKAKLGRGIRRRVVTRRRDRLVVRMKVRKLQKLIPGGRKLQPDRLFLRTADYILHLRLQVNILQSLLKSPNHYDLALSVFWFLF